MSKDLKEKLNSSNLGTVRLGIGELERWVVGAERKQIYQCLDSVSTS
ncbi:hypothetical protein [Leptospira santarosai]|nr:hypothetical protein [Leptospira santarosai]EKS06509.1 hypothetical protein LEP1GSC071_1194 [Leptospira santarosai str. JET]